MSKPSHELQEVESTLRLVIQSLIDGQEGFRKIGENLKEESLKRYFLAESLKRAEFRGELEEVLHQEGIEDINESGTASGTAIRVWGELKAKLGGGDHTLLVTAEEGEDEAKSAYREALENDLPLPVRTLLATQAAHIQNSHDFVKQPATALRNRLSHVFLTPQSATRTKRLPTDPKGQTLPPGRISWGSCG